MAQLKYGRELQYGERVRVYRNLNNGMISVMDMKGRIVAHVAQILISDAKFVVRPAGRRKVLVERRKNVHAFVVGTLFCALPKITFLPEEKDATVVKYNPYKSSTFFTEIENKPVREAKAVSVDKNGRILVLKYK